ncbi:hypothetical protein KDH_48330 [Dictyobacter sp. S3.2.2.5]|uniref:Uncharacterized protein n=1 Tax=Dictyobacter halimunensis TaxID=3026934 RepID=A0ABQ6FUQ4_9CHLR|nr:hypothetical protein KDH_48330 [Dictyobacter sp. S3.2.2.5]
MGGRGRGRFAASRGKPGTYGGTPPTLLSLSPPKAGMQKVCHTQFKKEGNDYHSLMHI